MGTTLQPHSRPSLHQAEGSNRAFRPLAVLSLSLCLPVVASCSLHYKEPDLGDLYSRAAQHHDADERAIIVIPGVRGSTLIDQAGGIVWGAFADGYAKPNTPEGARSLALPIGDGERLSSLRDEVTATNVLERIKVRILGVPLFLKAYLNILGVLGAGGYRDENLGLAGAVDYGDEHFTCFQFPYDFRRDNSENAKRLHEFMLEKRAYIEAETERRFGAVGKPVKFDIVAHSMGGLLLRYFLRYGSAELGDEGPLPEITWAGSELVERVVLIAPPNAGSIKSLVSLVEGEKFGPFLPRYPPAVLGTFPSMYQLLPRPRHGAVVLSRTGSDSAVDIYDPELWQRMGWGLADPDQDGVLQWLLPDVELAEERRRLALEHQRKALVRASRFTQALDVPSKPPPGLELYLVAGDAEPTDRVAAVEEHSGELRILEQGPGDGRVLRSSALLDERVGTKWSPELQSAIDWKAILFMQDSHLGMTSNPIFSDNVLYWLLEEPRD